VSSNTGPSCPALLRSWLPLVPPDQRGLHPKASNRLPDASYDCWVCTGQSLLIDSAKEEIRIRCPCHLSAGMTAAAESYSNKGVSPPDKGHHFLHIDDFSTDELRAMLASAAKASFD
jgi:hypothetical protein